VLYVFSIVGLFEVPFSEHVECNGMHEVANLNPYTAIIIAVFLFFISTHYQKMASIHQFMNVIYLAYWLYVGK
jgi:hypothetical protein